MDGNYEEAVAQLCNKYLILVNKRLETKKTSKLYYHMYNLKRALTNTMPDFVLNQEKYENLEKICQKFFPDERFFPNDSNPIVIDDSSDEEDLLVELPDHYNSPPPSFQITSTSATLKPLKSILKKPQNYTPPPPTQFQVPLPSDSLPMDLDFDIPSSPVRQKLTLAKPSTSAKPPLKPTVLKKSQDSIAVYKTKTLRLAPSSAYAKRSDDQARKQTLTVPYKNPIVPKNFAPIGDYIKLEGIKEKIYSEHYLKFDKTELKAQLSSNAENGTSSSSQNTSPSDDPKATAKLTVVKAQPRRKSMVVNTKKPDNKKDLLRRKSMWTSTLNDNNNNCTDKTEYDLDAPRRLRNHEKKCYKEI